MVKQVGLLSAGCQPWNNDVCAASGDRFAYCATLAIYVYELDRRFNQFKLLSIMSEHKKTISAIAWHPRKHNVFASSSFENKIIVWDIAEQRPLSVLDNTKGTPITLGWCTIHTDMVSYAFGRGPVFMWAYLSSSNIAISSVKESSGFSSEITCFRWHQKLSEKVAIGHQDGSLSFCILGSKGQRHVLRPEPGDDDEDYDNDCVVALEWDPLSMDYLLVSNNSSGIRLVDSVSQGVIMSFQLPSAATKVKTLSWVTSAPGMFLTGDSKSGILRVWNVSKSTPVENIRVKKTGFHALRLICDRDKRKSSSQSGNQPVSQDTSSTSIAQNPTKITTSNFALPPARIVCTFMDGGVGLYDLGRRKWDFLRDEGHIETIFDCKFCPFNSTLLATSSFDGTIKVWDINSFTCTNTSPGNEGIIYTISWAPSDLNCLVAGTAKGGLFIWDVRKGRIIKRFTEHGRSSVFTVVWNQKDSRKILSAGNDGLCIIRQVDGEFLHKYKHPVAVYGCDESYEGRSINTIIRQVDGALLHKYKHPAAVYGCDWNPHNNDMLATGCEDKNVRVYYTATSTDKPLKVFSGHSAKVFHVKWSPLKENLLCSGSDDGTIRIWDYSQEACINSLCGHDGPVRGLIWNTEIPYLIVSGSWDASLQVWDIRSGKCLDRVKDHGADVYGLTSHPSRPFIVASSSRDSTVRLWSLTTLVQPLEMNILAGKPWTEILSKPEIAMETDARPLLTGRTSKEIQAEAEEYPADVRNRVLKFFSKFFMVPAGTENLWELVSVLKGTDDTLLSPNYSKGIMHVKHLTKFFSSDAHQLEMAKLTKFGGGIGARSKEDRIREAAMLHLKTGNIQRYCELTVELGEWERALAVAPAVSLGYWRDLASRYAQYLVQEEKDSAAVFCAAMGDARLLAHFYNHRGQLTDAVLTAQVACEGAFPTENKAEPTKGLCNGWSEPSEKDLKLLEETVTELSEWHLMNGSPVLSACCFLSIDNKQKAMWRLIQGHELELAVAMGTVLGSLQTYTSVALEMLSRRCERLGYWELAIDLLRQIPDKVLLARCCARWSPANIDLDAVHKKAHLPSLEECFHEAEKLKRKNDVFECVMFYLLSSSPELGLELGLQHIQGIMKSRQWSVEDVFSLLQMLGCIRTEVLQIHRIKGQLLALSAYIGALVAIRRRYHCIVHPLFQHARSLLQRESHIDMGVSESVIQTECTAWNTVYLTHQGSAVNVDQIPAEYRQTYVSLLERAGEESDPVWEGPDCVASSHLPSHSDVNVSCLTQERIHGLAYFLEDGKSAVSANEALMWAKVNPFSPLATGLRINPF